MGGGQPRGQLAAAFSSSLGALPPTGCPARACSSPLPLPTGFPEFCCYLLFEASQLGVVVVGGGVVSGALIKAHSEACAISPGLGAAFSGPCPSPAAVGHTEHICKAQEQLFLFNAPSPLSPLPLL